MRPNRLYGRPKVFGVVAGMFSVLLDVSSVAAQTTEWADRAFVNVNMTQQTTARPLDESLAPAIYAERAVVTAPHNGDAGTLAVEPAGGIRIWKNLGIGAALTRQNVVETVTVQALVPHPILFNQPRLATKDAPFTRADTAVHVFALLMIPLHPRLDIALSAGPSFVSVRQDLLSGIEVAETGAPFTTVDITSVAVVTREVRTVGLNASADVTWFLTPVVGIGVTARYVRGYASTTLNDGRPVDLDIGGLQVGIGARLRFR